jgi:hypothetical protein
MTVKEIGKGSPECQCSATQVRADIEENNDGVRCTGCSVDRERADKKDPRQAGQNDQPVFSQERSKSE